MRLTGRRCTEGVAMELGETTYHNGLNAHSVWSSRQFQRVRTGLQVGSSVGLRFAIPSLQISHF